MRKILKIKGPAIKQIKLKMQQSVQDFDKGEQVVSEINLRRAQTQPRIVAVEMLPL